MNNELMAQIVKKQGHAKGRAGSVFKYCKYQCCAGDTSSWKNCTFTNCYLFAYRMPSSMQKRANLTHNLKKSAHPTAEQEEK